MSSQSSLLNNKNTKDIVEKRYSDGAKAKEEKLCCPVNYNPAYLKAIPQEVIEKDYGCGDPSQYLKEGETVLDLGSGTGKICFIASQVVGENGKVIGVDMTDDMLEIARKNAPIVAKNIGYSNVEFKKGQIQDLSLDLDLLDQKIQIINIKNSDDFIKAQNLADELSAKLPMIADNSIDVVVSNCVLNLVDNKQKKQLFSEIYRVLKNGGRAVISDIVSDEKSPKELQNDPELWSGCISGAYTEKGFLDAFTDTKFYGVEINNYQVQPWQTVMGIEYRSMTVTAYKGKEGKCLERNQAVIYTGPFSEVKDDDGKVYPRGVRIAVCDKTYKILKKSPYSGNFHLIKPNIKIPISKASIFDCSQSKIRHPMESKSGYYYKNSLKNTINCC